MYLIDQENMFIELGPAKVVELSNAFYNRVYADTDDWFRDLFPADKHQAIQNQYEFFIQRFGGPDLYSIRKGHPALRARHAPFQIPEKAVGRWLKYMKEAMEDTGIAGDCAQRLWEYFKDTAYFLQNRGRGGEKLY